MTTIDTIARPTGMSRKEREEKKFKDRLRPLVNADYTRALAHLKPGEAGQIVITPERDDLAWLCRVENWSFVTMDIEKDSAEHRLLCEVYDEERPGCLEIEFLDYPVTPAPGASEPPEGVYMLAIGLDRTRY